MPTPTLNLCKIRSGILLRVEGKLHLNHTSQQAALILKNSTSVPFNEPKFRSKLINFLSISIRSLHFVSSILSPTHWAVYLVKTVQKKVSQHNVLPGQKYLTHKAISSKLTLLHKFPCNKSAQCLRYFYSKHETYFLHM